MIIDELWDFESLRPFSYVPSWTEELAIRASSGFSGKLYVGLIHGMTFVGTKDEDGQIELSFSFPNRRPKAREVQSAFNDLGIVNNVIEESAKNSKVRHFVIVRGLKQ